MYEHGGELHCVASMASCMNESVCERETNVDDTAAGAASSVAIRSQTSWGVRVLNAGASEERATEGAEPTDRVRDAISRFYRRFLAFSRCL